MNHFKTNGDLYQCLKDQNSKHNQDLLLPEILLHYAVRVSNQAVKELKEKLLEIK